MKLFEYFLAIPILLIYLVVGFVIMDKVFLEILFLKYVKRIPESEIKYTIIRGYEMKSKGGKKE
jgi:hypothetical protein